MTESTPLYRQVHSSWIQGDRVTSQVFRPTPKDRKQLSVYDGNQVTAEQSWRHFTEELNRSSAGTLCVKAADCTSLGLQVISDPEPFPAHVLIDYSGLESKRSVENIAKRLRDISLTYGWKFKEQL